MEWLADNWIIVVLFGGMAAIQLIGRRRGGGHDCCGVGDHAHEDLRHVGHDGGGDGLGPLSTRSLKGFPKPFRFTGSSGVNPDDPQ